MNYYGQNQRRKLAKVGIFSMAFVLSWVTSAATQLQPVSTAPPRNYTDHYMQHVQNFHRPPVNVRDYTFDKYFKQNPNISPYLNLARHNRYGNNYFGRVLPERERREALNRPSRMQVVSSAPVPTGVIPTMTGPQMGTVPTPDLGGLHIGVNTPVKNPYQQKFSWSK